MHVGVVIPNVSFGTAVRHCAKSKRWGIVMRSLKLEREGDKDREKENEGERGGGGKEVSHHFALCELNICMH